MNATTLNGNPTIGYDLADALLHALHSSAYVLKVDTPDSVKDVTLTHAKLSSEVVEKHGGRAYSIYDALFNRHFAIKSVTVTSFDARAAARVLLNWLKNGAHYDVQGTLSDVRNVIVALQEMGLSNPDLDTIRSSL